MNRISNKRVSILINCMVRRNGMEIFSYEMAKGFIENGCDVYAIVPSCILNLNDWKHLPIKKLLIIDTYTTGKELIINTLNLVLKGNYWRIKREFSNIKIDIVYVPMLNLWSGMINSMFSGSKKFVTLHDPIAHSGANKLRTYIDEFTAKKADYIIILTEKFRDIVQEKYGFHNNNIVCVPHGNYSYYTKKTNMTKFPYRGRINYLFFGRIEDYKGLNVLADAYKIVYSKYKDISLTIAGNGNFSKYENKYKELSNVHIENRWIRDEEVGSFFDIENVIVVLPYLDATQSGVVSIAMNFGCPIIASGAGGLSEQIKNEETGLLVEAGNTMQLADAMIRLYENTSLRKMLVENSDKELKNFEWNVVSKILVDFVKQNL